MRGMWKENPMASKTAKLVPIDKAAMDVTPMGILQIAVQQGADVDKLATLLELQERWQANRGAAGLPRSHGKIQTKTAEDHQEQACKVRRHWNMTMPLWIMSPRQSPQTLSAVGISHRWKVSQSPEIAVTCVLTHEMGHSEETTLKAAQTLRGTRTPSRPSARR